MDHYTTEQRRYAIVVLHQLRNTAIKKAEMAQTELMYTEQMDLAGVYRCAIEALREVSLRREGL